MVAYLLEPDIESGDGLGKKLFSKYVHKKTQKKNSIFTLLPKKRLPTAENPPKNNHTGGFKLTKRVQIKVWRRPMDLTPFV
jgi:hypothetical protein